MSDNIVVKDGNNASVEMRTKETSGVHTPYYIAVPLDGVLETGLIELIGINESVSNNGFGASVAVVLSAAYSGQIEQIILVKTPGSGTSSKPTGKLLIFDADPTILLNASDMSVAALNAVIAVVDVQTGDWVVSVAAGEVAKLDVAIPFHALGTFYLAFQNTSGAAINGLAGDDVAIQANIWFTRQS
ncbi:MAG: hypothetical protein FOGNACKC_00932 [Anaerolineae bacterium]|nr:hypothetical protein [Anaerolineae bacterium]